MTDRFDRAQRWILYAIRFSLIVAGVLSLLAFRWTVLFVSFLTLLLTFLPNLFEKRYELDLPIEFELVIVLFIFATLFLGEVHGFYTRFWWWDAILHTGSAMAFGFSGFLILYALQRKHRIEANPAWIAVFAFCFAMAIGAVWEIFEFGMDSFFGLNMQKSGLIDTMWDLIVDALGALVTSAAGYFYLRTNKGTLYTRLLKKFFAENPDL